MGSGRIYVFSNIPYAAESRIDAAPDDTLVFINSASSIDYYADHKDRIVYHRKPLFPPEFPLAPFGVERLDVINRYVYDAGLLGVPEWFLRRIEEAYDYNYTGVPDNVKSPTTGYIVAKYLVHANPTREVVLVNFGIGIAHSTYRSPNHNWDYEDRELSHVTHITLPQQE